MLTTARAAVAGILIAAASEPLAAQTPQAQDRVQFIKVIARDYVFDAPATVQSGIATVQLVNQGGDIHHVTVQELPEGKSVKDYFDATRNSGRAPSWSRTIAQTATIANGAESFISFRMPPGRYILSCLIPAKDGRSHVAKGMYQVITATAAPRVAGQGVTRPAAARRP